MTIRHDKRRTFFSPARYRSINFVNLSMSALGIFDCSSNSVMTMMDDLGFDNNSRNQVIKKIITLSVRCTYYIFCRRNNNNHHHHQLFKHGSPFSKAGLQGAMHLKYYKNFKRANNNESRQGKRT